MKTNCQIELRTTEQGFLRRAAAEEEMKRVAQQGRCRLRLTLIAIFGVAASLLVSNPGMAQETRADMIRQEQADKQQRLQPPQPNGVERFLDRLEDWGLITGSPRGFYPWFGSVYSGGGFAAGVGARKPFGDDAR